MRLLLLRLSQPLRPQRLERLSLRRRRHPTPSRA
jgi:hypothetical protein